MESMADNGTLITDTSRIRSIGPLSPRVPISRLINNRSRGALHQSRNKYSLRRDREREEKCEEGQERSILLAREQRGSGAQRAMAENDLRSRLQLRMTKVDVLNSSAGSATPEYRRGSLHLAERECIRPTEVFEALEALSSTVVFNTASQEERLALASHLRHWAVEDGTYLIREGDGDAKRSALFMIASGKATVSLNRTLEDGSVQEVDIKDIKYPNYFGEGRVLGDSCAYASVRAKDHLVVYYLMRADIEELVSPKTRALMLRDMEIRKFQKEHMDDLFGVIRKNLSGMMCLTRFAREQLMDGDVLFFNDVEAYKGLAGDPVKQRERAWHIFHTYISPNSGGTGLIYTSEPQRKTLAGKMKSLWGSTEKIETTDGCDSKDDKGDAAAEEQGRGTRHAEYKVGNAQPHHSGDSKRDDDGSPSSNSIRRDGGEVSAGLSTAGTEEDVEKIDDELSWTLFDEILDQNAVPTICQQIIPKFIQSTYYELFLLELFPLLGSVDSYSTVASAADGSDTQPNEREMGGRHHSTSATDEVAKAMAAAAAAAAAGADSQMGKANNHEVGYLVPIREDSWAARKPISPPPLSRMSDFSSIVTAHKIRRSRHSWAGMLSVNSGTANRGSSPKMHTGGPPDDYDINDECSDSESNPREYVEESPDDDLLPVPEFHYRGIGWRLSRARLAVIQAARDACGMM